MSNSLKVNWLLFFEIYMRNFIDYLASDLTCHAGGGQKQGKELHKKDKKDKGEMH